MLNFEKIPSCAGIENKDDILNMAVALVKYAKMSREHGILALSDCFGEQIVKDNIFLNLMLHFLTEGMEMKNLEQYGRNYIETSCSSDDESLKYMLITEAIVNIMEGINEVYLAEILGSYLGFGMRDELNAALQQANVAKLISLK